MWILYSLFLFVSISGQDDVRLPPSITINPEEEIIFRELRDIKLTCSAKGTPPITFEWWHNGRSRCTTGSASPSLGVFAGDLTIKNATGKDDGFFQCFAKNGYGTALSRVAHVQHAFLQGGMPSNANITVQEGHPFVIPAARRNSFPTPTYSWETARVADDRSPEKILTTQRVNRAWNGDLHFAYALKDDDLNGGIYKSIIFNVHVEQTLGAGYTRVNVTQGSGLPPDFPPNITYFAKKQDVALIGRNVDLKCFFSGKPLPNITWSRPGNYLPLRRHTIPSSEYETLLSISNVMESDEGDYVCTANNSEGTVSHTFNIRVEAEPVFKQVYDGPYNVNLTEGDSITFNCSAFAEPKPNIVWLWNGKPIDATNVGLFTRFSFSNDNSSLTIRDVCRDCVDRDNKTDLMVIQCNASNVHGYAFAQGYLNVLMRTNVTLLTNSTFISVDLTKENRFQFNCRATFDPSTPLTVQWYKVVEQGQDLVRNEPPYVYVMKGNLTIHTQPNCLITCEKYLGEYRCIGDNRYTKDTVTLILDGTTGSHSSTFLEDNDGYTQDTATLTLYGTTESHSSTFLEDNNGYTQDTATLILNGTTGLHSSTFLEGNDGYNQDTTTLALYGTTGSHSSTFLEGNDAKATRSQQISDGSLMVVDKEFRDLLKMVNDLTADALNQMVVAEIVRQLSTLTNKSEGLSPGNLKASVMIIKQLVVLLRDSNIRLNGTEIESIIQATSNVLGLNNAGSWKKLNDVHVALPEDKITATDIWLIMDDFGLILANMSIPGPGHIAVYKDYLVLAAWSFEMSNSSLQIEFPNGSFWGENRGDRISISMETLNGSILSENSTNWKMWGVYYRNIHDKLPGKNDTDDVVNSRIISFSIDGLKTNETLKPPVIITLQHNEEKPRSYRRTCAFWNRSNWDSFGCSVTSTNKTHTTCSCNHLTNFAILMSRNPVYDTKLSLISIIGCSISVAALLLTVIIYALTWKHAKSSQSALLLNLCIALIIAYIIFMAGADKTDFSGYSMVGCNVVAVLLHYFFSVAFFIMLAEGVDMVLYIFFVFHVRRTRETVMLIASAWVLPMIIVGVSLGVTKLEGYGHDKACWLSIDNGLIWAFIGPVMCIIVINLIILIIILRLISKKKAILAKNSRKREEIRATIWNLSVMCPVLGLGWLFGVFSVSFDHVAFQYVFVIANSLHGLLIFIIYALFHNKKMNETISAVYSQYRKTDSSVSNHMNSSSQEHSTNSTANIRTTRPSLQPKSSDSDEFGTKAEVSTHNSGLKDSLLENKADIHQETAFDHR